jgi:hypothetical protein
MMRTKIPRSWCLLGFVCLTILLLAVRRWYLLLLLPNAVSAGLNFQYVQLDSTFYAYERDVGDIDGDGDNDIVGVQEGDTTVQVFRAPAWARSTLITFSGTYRYPRADDFKLADLNGDGKLDVITRLGDGPASDGPGLAVWCENLGGGTNFAQHTIGNSLEYVKDIVVADFDRDHRLDVAMRMDSRTQLWLRETNGAWTEVLLNHSAHEGLEVGDLDMDGDPDLILNGFWLPTPNTPAAARLAANYTNRVIDSAWFNQGGDWTADSCKVVVGDFDGDGTNDVAFSQSERAGYAVAWYRSATPNGGGPWTKHNVAVVDYCHNLQAADFDLDGKVDLLVGGLIQSQHRGLKLMLNNGGGTNWGEFIIQTDGSYSAETGDIDNDGDLDIVGIRNWNSAPTYIYRNNSAGGPSLDFWFYKQVSAAHVRTFGLCFPDVNGDSQLDIASGPFVYFNPGPPMTGAWAQVPLPNSVHAFATLDVDGDNLADLIAQQDNSGANRTDIFWLEATNAAGTAWKTPILIGDVPRSEHPESFQGYRVVQLIAGGRPEILINSPQGLYFFSVPATNPEVGNWPRTFIAANNSEEGVGVADLDGDGDLDISFTRANPHEVRWARNPGDGSGNWSVFTIGTFPEADWPDRCEAADLNGDGRADIIVTEENAGGSPDALACWWEQPATGATNANWPRHTITTQYTMNSLDVADVDKDGDVDLVLAEHRGTKRIAVWANNGLGNFTEHRVGEGRESHLGGRLIDLDSDGDLDLVSIAYDDFTKLHLWRNDSPNQAVPIALFIDHAEFLPPRVNLFFSMAAGQSYAVQYGDSLTSGSWRTLLNTNLPSVLTNMVVANLDASQTQGFYQIGNVSQAGEPVDTQLVMPAPGRLNLNFTASTGQSYKVNQRNHLDSGSWLLLTNFSVPPVLTGVMVTDFAPAQSQRFYQVRSLSPAGAPAQFEGAEFKPGSIDLYFSAAAHRSYSVEYRDALTSGSWQTLTNFNAQAVPTNWVASDFAWSLPQRFYRLKSS